MSNYAADDTQAIAQRLKEIEAEKQVALTGTSAPVTGQEEKQEPPSGYGDYSGYGGLFYKIGQATYANMTSPTNEGWHYAPVTPINPKHKERLAELKSAAHPNWPYAGTAHAWKSFVKQ